MEALLDRQEPRSNFLRLTVERIVLALVVVLTARTWLLEGFPVLCQVTGNSMADTLLGAHWNVACEDCGYRFPSSADLQGADARTVCPNCSFVNRLEGRKRLPGERVLIDRSAFAFRSPRRWEIVAFRRPGHRNDLVVKRIVGLPEETIQIHNGDVYVDGQPQRKTLPQQRATRVLVHDSGFVPGRDLAPKYWRGVHETQWARADGRWTHPANTEKDTVDWLVFEDNPHRLALGTDVMLAVRVAETFGEGLLLLQATDGQEMFETRLDPGSKRFAVLQNGRPVPGAAGKLPAANGAMLVEVSLFDQQFLLAVDGRELVAWPYDRSEESTPPLKPVAIASQGLGIVVKELKVYRDVYYTDAPRASDGEEGVRLGEGQYYVLGDNSPVSEDSRSWPHGPGISGEWFVGKPFLVLLPIRDAKLGGWHLRVPDLGRIRYIR